METHSVTRSSNNISTSPPMLRSFPSQAQGIAMVTAFMFESGLIVGGNMLAIILFAKEKKLRRKSLFLVMNMALADVMLGAVSAFVCLFVYRTLPSAVDCKGKYLHVIFSLFSWCHFFTFLANFRRFYILWKILCHLLATLTPNNVNAGV